MFNPINLDGYQYVGMNPVKYVDPTGMWTDPIKNGEIVSHFEKWIKGKKVAVHNPKPSTFGLVRGGGKQGHGGVDVRAYIGQEVVACGDGVVKRVQSKHSTEGFGRKVVIEFTYKYSIKNLLYDVFTFKWGRIGAKLEMDGKKYYAFYAHLNSTNVKVGQKVKEGQVIGTAGRDGNAKGIPDYRTHLHFAISPKSAWPKTGNRNVKSGDWINPEPFFQNLNTNPTDNRNWKKPSN